MSKDFQHLWVCISMDSAVPHGSQDMLYSLVPWLALCNGLPSLPAPRPNWTSPVKNLCGSICMGLHPQTVTGVYPKVIWSLQCTSQRAKSPEPRRKPTDSWLASLRHITNARKNRADRCLYSAHLAAVPWDAHQLSCLMTRSWHELQKVCLKSVECHSHYLGQGML